MLYNPAHLYSVIALRGDVAVRVYKQEASNPASPAKQNGGKAEGTRE